MYTRCQHFDFPKIMLYYQSKHELRLFIFEILFQWSLSSFFSFIYYHHSKKTSKKLFFEVYRLSEPQLAAEVASSVSVKLRWPRPFKPHLLWPIASL